MLGIVDEYTALAAPVVLNDQLAHQRVCIDALQAEIRRRGWDSVRSG